MKNVLLISFIFFLGSITHAQWINEIHYDNAGGDTGEGIEVAGPAGTDLSCYSLVPYNGNGGGQYTPISLSGTIPDEGCGYGAVWFSISGLQNGSPDGIALVDCGGNVVMFLSYEGSFVATDGPATGMLSTDIGVNEAGSTSGSSLQLIGSGAAYSSFSWQNEGPAASPGSLNAGQNITPCGSNTITTGAVSGAPFTVDCSGTVDTGTVGFTSVGTFNVGNVFTAQISDASGSFANPTTVGTLSGAAAEGVDPFGTINITIPSGMPSGANYLIQIIASNPATTGTSSAPFSILQTGSCGPVLPSGSGLIINEWSNGPTGNQEYYEFVVAGQCGTMVDIRGYILDDNNGTFTNPPDYDITPSGIAPGHFRFSYDPQWASIPVGSLIVVYNAAEPNATLPPDDENDSSPNDSLYVVPHTSTLFERFTTLPATTSPDSVYSPSTYSTAPLNGWGPLSLRNGGDAIQVRNPNGSYYHGVSYGGSEMTGGPHNLKLFTGSGAGMCGWFNDGDFFDAANWSTGATTGNQTPGLPNNAANAAWLALMRDPLGTTCPITVLPVELSDFNGIETNFGNKLYWQTISERNADYFTIERSTNGKDWEFIANVTAVGNSEDINDYQTYDVSYEPVVNYYRISQTDMDGTVNHYSKMVVINNMGKEAIKLVGIYNILGQEITKDYKGVQIHVYSDGTSQKIFND